MDSQADPFPYCGAPAIPADLWTRWNWDPILIAALLGLALLHAGWLMRGAGGGTMPRRALGFWLAGWGLMAVVFISPLCALASALFSARSAHHMLLIAVIPPLLLLAGGPGRARQGGAALTGLAILHGVILWGWHVPAAYAAALADVRVYWLMQATLFGSALLLWRGVFARSASAGAVASSMAFTFMQTGFLGALLVFAGSPLYAYHLATTPAWGLDPLADQQLAGVLMWTIGGGPYLWAVLASVKRLITPPAEALAA